MTECEVEYELRGELGLVFYDWLIEHGKRDLATVLKLRYQEWRSWFDMACRMSTTWSRVEQMDATLTRLAKDFFETEYPDLEYINIDDMRYNFIIRNGRLCIEPISAEQSSRAEVADNIQKEAKDMKQEQKQEKKELTFDESEMTVGDILRGLRGRD